MIDFNKVKKLGSKNLFDRFAQFWVYQFRLSTASARKKNNTCIPDRVTEGGGGFTTARILNIEGIKMCGWQTSETSSAFKMDESERELLFRSRQERKAIVAKYDKGREPGAEIDDWEDPKNELFHAQDRYGFIQ